MNSADVALNGRLCEVALPVYDSRTWMLFCLIPASEVHLYTCRCGHTRRRATCPVHRPEPGVVGCRACFEAGHECEMTAELLPVDEW